MRFVKKKLEMEENVYQLFQHKLEVHEVMRVHREEGVMLGIHECCGDSAGFPNSNL
jgi:hypothetical protein